MQVRVLPRASWFAEHAKREHSASAFWGRANARLSLALLSTALGLLHAEGAHAQIEIAPYAGVYRPTSILGSGSGVTLRQQGSLAMGVRVAHWWPGRFGMEGTLSYAPSRLISSRPDTNPAHVLIVSAKGLLRVTPPRARVALHLGAGVGLVAHGGHGQGPGNGEAYPPDYAGPTTFVSGIANLGTSTKLSKRVAVRLDVEDFIYSARVGSCYRYGGSVGVCDISNASRTYGGALPTAPIMQNDLVISLAFAVTLDRIRLGTGSGE